MRVLIDTNVLISALFYPDSIPARALLHAADNHVISGDKHFLKSVWKISAFA